MYGLTSRESLSKRQSRWVRAVDEDVRSNPVQKAFSREAPSNPIRDNLSIIKVMTNNRDQNNQIIDTQDNISQISELEISQNKKSTGLSPGSRMGLSLHKKRKPFNNYLMGIIPDNDSDELEIIQSYCEEVHKKCNKLEQDYNTLKQEVSDKSSFISRIQKLEQLSEERSGQASGRESELVSKMKKLEQAIQNKYNIEDIIGRVKKSENDSGTVASCSIAALSNDISSLMDRVKKLEEAIQNKFNTEDIIDRVKKLENISSLINRVSALERSLIEISSHSVISKPIGATVPLLPLVLPPIISDNNPSELNVREYTPTYRFIPYIIKEDYASCDCLTELIGLHLKMTVDIIGFYQETPIIYPFGTETKLPRFAELNLELSFKDDKREEGTAYGILTRRTDGIYTIQLTELYSDGHASRIENYTLPLTLKCETDLILE
jgi:hypothetical protein